MVDPPLLFAATEDGRRSEQAGDVTARYTHYMTSVLLVDADVVSERIDLALKGNADADDAPQDREADLQDESEWPSRRPISTSESHSDQ